MKTIFNLLFTFLFAAALLLACNNDSVGPIGTNDKNAVTLEFDNRVGAQKMALNTTTYKNGSGEDFTLTTFNYFISNVALKKADGTVVKFPDQYFLIRQSDPTTWEPELQDVPAADYKEISFVIGVDSTRSVSDISARTGVLDPTSYGDDAMYWSWNSGYIFVKMEGTSPVVALNSAGKRAFQLHVGGYGGRTAVAPNNIRSVTLPLNGTATVRKDIAPTIHLVADALKVFNGTTTIKLAETNSVHNPALAGPIANNYMKMFVVDHVHND
jgi:hypothetical protein